MLIWDQVFWAFLAISVWILYQTEPYKLIKGKIRDLGKNRLGLENPGILANWVFWAIIPSVILLSHGALGRMRIKLPIAHIDIMAVWILIFFIAYGSGLIEFYLRNRLMRDAESARRVVDWTEGMTWGHGIIGGLKQNVPEETFFRGYLLAETYAFSPWIGYSFSSLVFGLVHRYWDRWKILTTTFSGILFAYLFIYTDSIIPPITVHIATNLLIIPPARHWSKNLLASIS